ncbi:MAG: beta-glucosidase, partial [Bacteroidales bacterium]|nr:beta-glucosidase [Bacteroidales bacterium]
MKPITKYAAIMTLAGTMAGCNSQMPQQTAGIDQQVNTLYEKMTNEERVAQLCGIYMTQFFDENGKLLPEKCAEKIPNGIGHCSQFALNTQCNPEQLRDMVAQMQDWLIKNTPSGIPALMHEEVLSGVNALDATVYPQQIGLACSFNPELAEQKTFQTATSLRKIGGFLSLSPMIDVVRDPSFNRLEESYGEDAYLSAVMATAFVRGLQHGDLQKGVAACTKHFLGYGGGGNADKKELMEEILLPHEACIRQEGSKVVMTGYHAVDGTKCVANSQIQKDILRDYLGYDGIMVSDYGSIDQVDDNMTPLQRAAAAINAGNDVDFPQGDNYKLIPEAIKQGLVTEQTFEAAVKRVLK